MEVLFKKYFWLVKMAGVAVVVIFAASAGVNLFVGKLALEPAGETIVDKSDADELDEEEEEEEIRERQSRMLDTLAGDTTKSRKEAVANLLVAANIFCPACAPATVPGQEAAVSGTASMGMGAAPVPVGSVPSKLPLMLLATMESDDPEYSMATILHTDSNVLAPYVMNDTIRAGVVVTQVTRGRVVLRNGAQLEYIDIGVAPPPTTATAAPVPAAVPLPEGDENSREIEGAAEAISCSDSESNSCTVDRAFVEKLLANPAQLAKQARIVPAVRDGETKGYKFYGIRPGSLPKLLGIKNGDLLTSVNGHQLESLDQAMDLYNKLRRASHLSVTIERKGQLVQKEIDIK
jgi:type II secretion system protein C